MVDYYVDTVGGGTGASTGSSSDPFDSINTFDSATLTRGTPTVVYCKGGRDVLTADTSSGTGNLFVYKPRMEGWDGQSDGWNWTGGFSTSYYHVVLNGSTPSALHTHRGMQVLVETGYYGGGAKYVRYIQDEEVYEYNRIKITATDMTYTSFSTLSSPAALKCGSAGIVRHCTFENPGSYGGSNYNVGIIVDNTDFGNIVHCNVVGFSKGIWHPTGASSRVYYIANNRVADVYTGSGIAQASIDDFDVTQPLSPIEYNFSYNTSPDRDGSLPQGVFNTAAYDNLFLDIDASDMRCTGGNSLGYAAGNDISAVLVDNKNGSGSPAIALLPSPAIDIMGQTITNWTTGAHDGPIPLVGNDTDLALESDTGTTSQSQIMRESIFWT